MLRVIRDQQVIQDIPGQLVSLVLQQTRAQLVQQDHWELLDRKEQLVRLAHQVRQLTQEQLDLLVLLVPLDLLADLLVRLAHLVRQLTQEQPDLLDH